MDILEKELEDMLFKVIEDQDFESLETRGLHLDPQMHYYRQVNLAKGGIADIVGIRKIDTPSLLTVFVTVIELKRHNVNIDTFVQANNYLNYIEQMIRDYIPSAPEYKELNIVSNIVLIGDSVHQNILALSYTFASKITAYEYSMCLIDGISFWHSSEFWDIENEALDNTVLYEPFA